MRDASAEKRAVASDFCSSFRPSQPREPVEPDDRRQRRDHAEPDEQRAKRPARGDVGLERVFDLGLGARLGDELVDLVGALAGVRDPELVVPVADEQQLLAVVAFPHARPGPSSAEEVLQLEPERDEERGPDRNVRPCPGESNSHASTKATSPRRTHTMFLTVAAAW